VTATPPQTVSVDTAAADVKPFKLGYRPPFDGLRGVGILLVMIVHSFWLWPWLGNKVLRGGYISVDMFFVLSGFLITSLLIEEFRASERISMRSFFRRRAFRLLPGLFFVILCSILFTLAIGANMHAELNADKYVLTYTGNWYQAITHDAGALNYQFDQTWSLAVEAQYYVVWGVLLTVLLVAGVRPRAIAYVLLVGALCVMAWRWHLSVGLPSSKFEALYIRTDTRLDPLLVGGAISCLYYSGWRPGRWRRVFFWVGAAFIVPVVITQTHEARWMYEYGFTVTAFMSAFVIIGCIEGVRGGGWLSSRPIVEIGKWSYEIYLWHLPIFVALARYEHPWPAWLRIVVGWTVAFTCSYLAYRYIERPALKWKRGRRKVAPAPAVAPSTTT
jgi:peptidoglycan/LPS O-acetylase OafA/YrhL